MLAPGSEAPASVADTETVGKSSSAMFTVADDGVPGLRQAVVIALVAVWGARLTWNWYRGWSGLDHEDWRYVNIRETTGSLYWPARSHGEGSACWTSRPSR